ncbi:hypothetical protein [Streptomyces zagrosensis]|uniref:Lipoprotein n=1 Tax=Streptomyces zagrosensis TaxID=1042984 RepID=A0A7W9UWV3_9ACTN|nr:hypothetical protein [Streptomyces zagrosensis]MBB5934203.1 hypothetical protein [Streptomyces zagrosensis]
MRLHFTLLAKPALATLLAIGLATGCSWVETTPESNSDFQERLPADPDKARSKKNALDFRAWVSAHGTPPQREAATHVQRIIGEWDAQTGRAYISTDINGGIKPVEDSMAAAMALAAAFDHWKTSKQSSVSVYDVMGNALIANYEF